MSKPPTHYSVEFAPKHFDRFLEFCEQLGADDHTVILSAHYEEADA